MVMPGVCLPVFATSGSFQSDDTATSCGPSPVGTRPATFPEAGSTIASVASSLFKTRRAREGVSAAVKIVARARLLANRERFILVTVYSGSEKPRVSHRCPRADEDMWMIRDIGGLGHR